MKSETVRDGFRDAFYFRLGRVTHVSLINKIATQTNSIAVTLQKK